MSKHEQRWQRHFKKIHTGAEATGGSWSNRNTAAARRWPTASDTGEENRPCRMGTKRRQFQHFTLQTPVSTLVWTGAQWENSLLHNNYVSKTWVSSLFDSVLVLPGLHQSKGKAVMSPSILVGWPRHTWRVLSFPNRETKMLMNVISGFTHSGQN